MMRKLIAVAAVSGSLALGLSAWSSGQRALPTPSTPAGARRQRPPATHAARCAKAEKVATRIQALEAKAAAGCPRRRPVRPRRPQPGTPSWRRAIGQPHRPGAEARDPGNTLLAKIAAKCGSATSASVSARRSSGCRRPSPLESAGSLPARLARRGAAMVGASAGRSLRSSVASWVRPSWSAWLEITRGGHPGPLDIRAGFVDRGGDARRGGHDGARLLALGLAQRLAEERPQVGARSRDRPGPPGPAGCRCPRPGPARPA